MDPVSIASILSVTTAIIKSCAEACFNLKDIRRKWNEAPNTLNSIETTCTTIGGTLRNIKKWLQAHASEVNGDHEFMQDLSAALKHCSATMERLKVQTAAIRLGSQGKLRKWNRFKLACTQSTLNECLTELRWQATAACDLLQSFKDVPLERRRRVARINLSQRDHSTEVNTLGSYAGSILDADLDLDIENVQTSVQSRESRAGQNLDSVSERRSSQDSEPAATCCWITALLVLAVGILYYNFFSGAVELDMADCVYTNSSSNWSPLHYAAVNGTQEDISRKLRCTDFNWRADDDLTPLHLAAIHGRTDVVRQLLKVSGYDANFERAEYPQAVEKLRKAVGSRFEEHFNNFFRRKTFTARELAAIYGHGDTALAFGRTWGGRDPLRALSCACMLGNAKMVAVLRNDLKNGWFYQKSWWGETQARWFPAPPLHLAVMSGSRETVALFLERGRKARHQSTNYWIGFFTKAYAPYSTPAHYAAAVGSTKILKDLERKGAGLTALDNRSRTPLSYAVANLNEAAVAELVKHKPSKRGGWLFGLLGSSVYKSYLGSGHVWPNKGQSTADIPNPAIRKALEKVGFPVAKG